MSSANATTTTSAIACEARVLDRIKPLAKLAAMAVIGELIVIDGSNSDLYSSCVGRMAGWAQPKLIGDRLGCD
jgi:hypothetical protein